MHLFILEVQVMVKRVIGGVLYQLITMIIHQVQL